MVTSEKSLKIDPSNVIIKSKLDEGGQGEVYSGTYFENEVVIKIYKKLTRDDVEEVKVYQLLEHETMVKFYGCYKLNDKLHIILEKAKGIQLDHLILIEKDLLNNPDPSKTLNLKEKLYLFKQLTNFLVYLKKNSVIHRDLKPSNIMITKNDKSDSNIIVKLFDFGISKISNNTFTYTISTDKFSVYYSSPEQYLIDDDKTMISGKVDIWALGCIMSYVFSGVVPWTNKTRNIIRIQHYLLDKVKFPIPDKFMNISDEYKPNITTLLELCLKTDPLERLNAFGVDYIIDALYEDITEGKSTFKKCLTELSSKHFA